MVAAEFARNRHDAGKARAHADNATTVDADDAATTDDDDDDAHLTRAEPSSHAA